MVKQRISTPNHTNRLNYEARYAAHHRAGQSQWLVVRDVVAQRTHENRYNWATILLQTFRTSPIAVSASLRWTAFTALFVTPYCLFEWRDRLGEVLTPEAHAALLPHLQHPLFEASWAGMRQGAWSRPP